MLQRQCRNFTGNVQPNVSNPDHELGRPQSGWDP